MKRNYESIINVNRSLSKIIRISFYVSGLVMVITLCLIISSILARLPKIMDLLIIIFNCIPVIYLNIIVFSYENKTQNKYLSKKITISFLILLSIILVPLIFYSISNFYDFEVKIIINSFTLPSLIVLGRTLFSKKFSSRYHDLIYILRAKWFYQNNDEIEINHFTFFKDVNKNIGDIYKDKNSIQVFQKIFTCHRLNAVSIIDHIDCIDESYKILDIGGAEGKFTGELIKSLNCKFKEKIDQIKLIDPANFSNEYRKNLGSFIKEEKISYINSSFQESPVKRETYYDLIIASHSLYEPIDNGIGIDRIITKINNLRKKEKSKIIIVLSSKESRAYNFKNHCLQSIFGKESENLVSEKFIESLSDRFEMNQLISDNFFDFTNYINDKKQLKIWLSYFLRINFDNYDDIVLEAAIDTLKQYLQPLYELSEEIQKRFKDVDNNITDNSIILTHKSEIIIF